MQVPVLCNCACWCECKCACSKACRLTHAARGVCKCGVQLSVCASAHEVCRLAACRAMTGSDPIWCQEAPSWDQRCVDGWSLYSVWLCGKQHHPSLHRPWPCWRLVRSGRRGPIRRPKTKTRNTSDQAKLFVVRDLGPSVMFCGRKHVVTGRFLAMNHTGFDVDRLHSVT